MLSSRLLAASMFKVAHRQTVRLGCNAYSSACPERTQQLALIQKRIGYCFRNPLLLDAALTHPSCPGTKPTATSRGRLEFLGDKVLGLLVSQQLLEDYPLKSEGDLTIRCATIVNNEALAEISKCLRLNDALRAAPRMKMGDKGAADTLEAIVGALYLDSDKNLESVAVFVKQHIYAARSCCM